MLRVARLGLLQQLELLLCGRALVQLLPLLQGHAVHVRDRLVVAHVDAVVQRARVVPGGAERKQQVVAKRKLQVVATGATAAGGTAPFGEAVAAEPGQDHDVDVLHVGPHAQVLRELRKGVGFSELVGRSHGRAPCWRKLTCRLWLELCEETTQASEHANLLGAVGVATARALFRLSSCLAGELSPLVHRPPNSASSCTHPPRRSKAPDPKEQVKEWKKQMRGEERKLDRQIQSELRARLPPRRGAAWLTPPLPTPEIKNEETKVKQSIKQAAKRGDMSTAKLLAKEIVRSRKAVSRLHTSKAQMNSVVMQMQNQMGAPGRPCCTTPSTPHPLPHRRMPLRAVGVPPAAQQKVMGHMVKSTQIMGAMNRLVKIGDISQTMQAMQQEMCKVCATPEANPNLKRRPLCHGAEPPPSPVRGGSHGLPHTACPVTFPQAGLIEEMVDDSMEALDDDDDDDAADEEVDKVMQELNADTFANSSSAPTRQVQQQEAAEEDDAEEEQMRARLQELRG